MRPTFEVYVGAVNGQFIGGPFSVTCIKDVPGQPRRIVSSVTGIQRADLANYRAQQMVDHFGATLPLGLIEVKS